MTSPAKALRLKSDVALVFVTFIWGSTFVVVKDALANISPFFFLAIRFSLAVIALALVFGRKAARAGDLRYNLRAGALVGVLLWSGYVLQTIGLQYTSPSKTGFLTGLAIPMVPVFSAIFYRRMPSVAEACGIGCAAVGMGLMTLQGDVLRIGFGDLLVILSAVTWALHVLTIGHFTARANAAFLSLAQVAMAAVLGLATFWWAEPVRVAWKPQIWFALGVTSLFATAFAFSVQTWAQQFSSPTRTALIFALEGVFAWLTSFVLTGELLTPRATFGAGLILTGILLVELNKTEGKKREVNMIDSNQAGGASADIIR